MNFPSNANDYGYGDESINFEKVIVFRCMTHENIHNEASDRASGNDLTRYLMLLDSKKQ